jgi:hypothetical protein
VSYQLPPICKHAQRLLLDVERAVARFPRAHKYSLGARLREEALQIAAHTIRAARDRQQRQQQLQALDRRVDQIKLLLELAQKLNACSYGQFETLYRTAAEIGQQCGGWLRQHPMGQSPAAQNTARPERAPILSTPAASTEANA